VAFLHDLSSPCQGQRPTLPRIPPNFFGISLGLAGLAEVWILASPILGITNVIGRVLLLVAAAAWTAVAVTYFSKGPKGVQDDWRNPIVSPFLALVVLVPTLLAGELCQVELGAGRVLVIILSSLSVFIGGWSSGQWVVNDLYDECMHPGYLLPTATGGFIGSIAASAAHLHLLAAAWFGVGLISWLLVASIVLNRLFIRPRLSPALTPTLALEAGPPLVAGVAYHGIHGGSIDGFAALFGGYAILMIVLQLRLAPLYVGLAFTAGFWSFTFPTAAFGLDGMVWLESTKPAGYTVYAALLVAFVSVVIGAVAVRSTVAISRHQFFPKPPHPDALNDRVPEPEGAAPSKNRTVTNS
jgi:tellurite resistance protein